MNDSDGCDLEWIKPVCVLTATLNNVCKPAYNPNTGKHYFKANFEGTSTLSMKLT